ncbi:MAG: hypothetical protein AB4352_09810 [Hormoscilla sp.]
MGSTPPEEDILFAPRSKEGVAVTQSDLFASGMPRVALRLQESDT